VLDAGGSRKLGEQPGAHQGRVGLGDETARILYGKVVAGFAGEFGVAVTGGGGVEHSGPKGGRAGAASPDDGLLEFAIDGDELHLRAGKRLAEGRERRGGRELDGGCGCAAGQVGEELDGWRERFQGRATAVTGATGGVGVDDAEAIERYVLGAPYADFNPANGEI